MDLTRKALSASRLTIAATLLVTLAGIFAFLGFPSQEEPSVTVRDAVLLVQQPGMPAERVEELLVRPLEERLRELPELKRIVSTVRPGSGIVQITARDEVAELRMLWQRVRSKAAEAAASFPPGTIGPFVDDDFGRVAVASIAVVAPGFTMGEMREPLKRLRQQLYTLPGVDRINFHGLQEERVYLEFDRERIAALGVDPALILAQLRDQHVLDPGGLRTQGGMAGTVAVSGEIRSAQDLANFVVALETRDGRRSLRLGDLVAVRVLPADPPEGAAVYRGEPAVVLAVSMAQGRSIAEFGAALRAKLDELAPQLPLGFEMNTVTFQADVVEKEMAKMHQVVIETVAIVMAVVMFFLGWRTGLIVGSIVPFTILGTLVAMRMLGIELHSVSIAAIIIALGLLVDNGIVIAEDIERRIAAGEDRKQACIDAGRTLALPLLTSSLVIILAFSPFFLGQTTINEYLRSLVVVLAITLLGSWVLALTVTPLLAYWLARPHAAPETDAAYDTRFYRGYRRVIELVLAHRIAFLGTMLALLIGALGVLATIPADFLPRSDRPQFQIGIEMQPGADARATLGSVRAISRWLADPVANPEIVDSIGYVAEGGPRIILSLTPPLPAPGVGYFTVNVKPGTDLDAVIERTRAHLLAAHPELRATPKRFSLGSTDSGTVVYRITGPDEAVLRSAADRVKSALSSLPGTVDVRDNWSSRVPRTEVEVDQARARAAGVSTRDIVESLRSRYGASGVITMYDAEQPVAVVVRGSGVERERASSVESSIVYRSQDGKAIPLAAVATTKLLSEPGAIQRYNLSRAITVEGRNPAMTAAGTAAAIASQVTAIQLPSGYRIEMGGEIEEAAEADRALLEYLPHALVAMILLFVWQFNSFRKLGIILASIPFVLIGVAIALKLSGYPFGFMATFGLLALAGIIVNNAVLLLERIDEERAHGASVHGAVVEAAVKRLRPIVMTKLTCILGLVPLMLFAGPLWTGMAITIMGGLALGTLVTLGLIPVLYEIAFASPRQDRAAAEEDAVTA